MYKRQLSQFPLTRCESEEVHKFKEHRGDCIIPHTNHTFNSYFHINVVLGVMPVSYTHLRNKRTSIFKAVALCLIAAMSFTLVSCDDDMDIQQSYPFTADFHCLPLYYLVRHGHDLHREGIGLLEDVYKRQPSKWCSATASTTRTPNITSAS